MVVYMVSGPVIRGSSVCISFLCMVIFIIPLFLIVLLYLQFDRLLEGLLFVYLSLYVDIHNTILFDSVVSLAVLSCQFVLHFI